MAFEHSLLSRLTAKPNHVEHQQKNIPPAMLHIHLEEMIIYMQLILKLENIQLGGWLRSLTPAAATLSRGCFLHPGIFWSLHPGSSKVPGPKTGSKCDGTFRSGPLPQPLRPVRPSRPLRRPWLSPAGCRGRGRSPVFAQPPRQGPARRARGLRRRLLQLLAAGTAERSPGRCGEPAGAENGGGLEELNGAGTPGGGPESRRRAPGACGRVLAGRRSFPA